MTPQPLRHARSTRLGALLGALLLCLFVTPVASSATATGHAPVVTSVSPDSGPNDGGNTVVITGRHLLPTKGGTSVLFGDLPATSVSGTTKSLRVIAPELPGHGYANVDVTVVTADGTSAHSSADMYTYDDGVPVITSISPDHGFYGTTVTVTGYNLTGFIQFGGNFADSQSGTSTVQTVTVPHISEGTYYVSAVNEYGTSAITAADLFTYETPLQAPDYLVIDPSDGPSSGGNTAIITGGDIGGINYLKDITGVSVDGVPVPFTFDGAVTLTMPAHTPGDVDVAVSNAAGTGYVTYTYDDASPPRVTDVSLPRVSSNGTQGVTLTGNDLYNATSVDVDGVPVDFTLAADATSIFFRAPAHSAGAVPVVVTTPAGSSTPVQLNYYQARTPHIGMLTPDAAKFGTPVTITGLSLNGATKLRINWVSIPFTQRWDRSGAILTFTAPWHSPGSWPVVVTTPAGNSNIAMLTYGS